MGSRGVGLPAHTCHVAHSQVFQPSGIRAVMGDIQAVVGTEGLLTRPAVTWGASLARRWPS